MKKSSDSDGDTTSRVVESIVARGDISALSPTERAKFYVQMCESLGLSPGSQPLAMLRLNGKEVLYPTRGATDQLAAIHRVNREIVDGPKVVDLAGTKLVYAVCKATLPNGRTETAVGTVPLTDPVNALMKCECVPVDSEILTRHGWKTHEQLLVGEEVLAYDLERDQCRWTPLERVSVYSDMPVSELHSPGRQFSVRCTPNHKWAVRHPDGSVFGIQGGRRGSSSATTRKPPRALVEAWDLDSSQRLVLAAREREREDSALDPETAELLGRSLARGGEGMAGVSLPRLVTRLNFWARAAMLRGLLGSDLEFATPCRAVMDAFEILAALQGTSTELRDEPGPLLVRALGDSGDIPVRDLELRPAGKADVWCPSTRYGTWVMRQNGHVMITGNTKAKRRATLSILGLGMLDETELETIPSHLKSPGDPVDLSLAGESEGREAEARSVYASAEVEAEALAFREQISQYVQRGELTPQLLCEELLRTRPHVGPEDFSEIFGFALEALRESGDKSASLASLRRWLWAVERGRAYQRATSPADVDEITAGIVRDRRADPSGLAWLSPKKSDSAGADVARWLSGQLDAAKRRTAPAPAPAPATPGLTLEDWAQKSAAWKNEYEAQNSWKKNSALTPPELRESALAIASAALVSLGLSPDSDQAAAWLQAGDGRVS